MKYHGNLTVYDKESNTKELDIKNEKLEVIIKKLTRFLHMKSNSKWYQKLIEMINEADKKFRETDKKIADIIRK